MTVFVSVNVAVASATVYVSDIVADSVTVEAFRVLDLVPVIDVVCSTVWVSVMSISLVSEDSIESDGVGGGVMVIVRVTVTSKVPFDILQLSEGDALVTSDVFVAVIDGNLLKVSELDSVREALPFSCDNDMLLTLVVVSDDELMRESVSVSVKVGRIVGELVGRRERDREKLAERMTDDDVDQLSDRTGGVGVTEGV